MSKQLIKTPFPFSMPSLALFLLLSCNSDSCTETVPGGFPSESRSSNRIQVKLTTEAMEKISADTAILDDFNLAQDVTLTPSCSSTPEICCSGGTPQSTCGPVVIDTDLQEGDLPRLELSNNVASNTIEVTLRARIRTANPIRISSFGIACELSLDTSRGTVDDITFVVGLAPSVDPFSRNTRFDVVGADLNNLQSDDLDLDGSFLCDNILDPLLGLLRGTIRDEIESQVESALNDGLCMACPSGSIDECNEFAEACTDNTCMAGGTCVQELGVSGAISGESIAANIMGKVHLQSVLGESVEIQNNGLLFSFLTGSLPLADSSPCGPEAIALPITTAPSVDALNGDVDPSNNEGFDIAIALHQNYLNQFLISGYNAGFFCMDIGVESSDQLVSESIGPLLFPSLTDLLDNQNTPIQIGLRPQLAPVVFLGQQEVGDEHTLLFQMPDLEFDFIVPIAGQDVVVLTAAFDLTLPIRLTPDENGNILLDITDLTNAAADFKITDKHGLLESDEDLESRIPLFIQVALPGLLGSLDSFSLPGVGNVQLKVKEDGIKLLEDDAFLALFANLEPSDGTTQSGGCSTVTSATPWGAFLILFVFAFSLRKKRTSFWLVVSMFATGCSSCGDDDNALTCEDTCLPGSLPLQDIGLYNDIAQDNERTLVLAYEKTYGDLLAKEVNEDQELPWKVIDGVPNERPVYEPDTFRNGIEAPGPDRGQSMSLFLMGGLGYVSYLGKKPESLHLAAEDSSGKWSPHAVLEDIEGESHFTSIGQDAQGRLLIAYNRVAPSMDGFESSLNVARSTSPSPKSKDDWEHQRVARADVPCWDESCQSPRPEDVISSPVGTGLFIQLLGPNSEFVSYYDSIRNTWNLSQYVNGAWTDLHEQNNSGRHSSVFLDSNGVFHVAYQHNRKLKTFSFDPNNGASSVAVIDDGLREGSSKPNQVGQGNAIFLQGNALQVLYQDGSNANLRLAQKNSNDEWTSDVFIDVDKNSELVGFRTHIGGQGGTRWVSTYKKDLLSEQKGKLLLKKSAE